MTLLQATDEMPVMTDHTALKQWVQQTADLCEPDQIVWWDGSKD